MELEDIMIYVESIKNDKAFQELNNFIGLTKRNKNKSEEENVENYARMYLPQNPFQIKSKPDYEKLMKFLKSYMEKQKCEVKRTQNGDIDLSKTIYLIQPPIFLGCVGAFVDYWIMMADGTKYLQKRQLHFHKANGIEDKSSMYAAIIGQEIAKELGVEAAEYILAKKQDGIPVTLSKNFLLENEEIIYYDNGGNKEAENNNIFISEELDKIEKMLQSRRYKSEEIEQVKLEFLKQEFIAKIIGLKDQKPDNSPLIIGTKENGERYVKMAPMCDLDYSFFFVDKIDMLVRKCENGKADVQSFMEQYQDYPGMKDFFTKKLETFSMENVFKELFAHTGNPVFAQYQTNEGMQKYEEFVNANIEKAREVIVRIHSNDRGEL